MYGIFPVKFTNEVSSVSLYKFLYGLLILGINAYYFSARSIEHANDKSKVWMVLLNEVGGPLITLVIFSTFLLSSKTFCMILNDLSHYSTSILSEKYFAKLSRLLAAELFFVLIFFIISIGSSLTFEYLEAEKMISLLAAVANYNSCLLVNIWLIVCLAVLKKIYEELNNRINIDERNICFETQNMTSDKFFHYDGFSSFPKMYNKVCDICEDVNVFFWT